MSKSQLKTEFVCVATAGATVDGREISSQDLNDMAETYSPDLYTAMIWYEHYRFFGNLGQVLSLKTEEIDGKTKLFAELRPTAELLEFNQAGQKLFTSIEIMPNFARTGKAYLGGLAVTDSPASTGTTQLNFSARGVNQADLLIGNKEELHFSINTANTADDEEGFLTALFEAFKKFTGNNGEPKPHIEPTFSNNDNNKQEKTMTEEEMQKFAAIVATAVAAQFSKAPSTAPEQEPQTEPKTVTAEEFNALKDQFDGLQEKFNALSKTEVTPVPEGKGSESENKFKMAV